MMGGDIGYQNYGVGLLDPDLHENNKHRPEAELHKCFNCPHEFWTDDVDTWHDFGDWALCAECVAESLRFGI